MHKPVARYFELVLKKKMAPSNRSCRLPATKTNRNGLARPEFLQSRRAFISTASALGTMTVVGGSVGVQNVAADRRRKRKSRGVPQTTWVIEAARADQTFGDGSVRPFFRFFPIEGTPEAGRLPVLEADEHQAVRLTVRNRLDFAVQPMIVGFENGPVIAPDQEADWTFTMPRAGTWLLTEALLGPAAGPVGFGATLISRPLPGGHAESEPNYPNAEPIFNIRGYDISREYVLLYQDADDRWNLDLDAGNPPDTSLYEPNYHTVNGLTFPDTISDPNTMLACNAGENVLIRLGNLGHVRHAIHFHGYHADMVSRNNENEEMLPLKDTFPLPGYTTAELVLPVMQSGVFPLHPHSLTTTTDGGTYPFGQITLISASP